MSVQKHKVKGEWTGKWRARVRDASGRQATHVSPTKSDAAKWERDFLTRRDKGIELDLDGGKITFKEFAEAWRVMQEHRSLTIQDVESKLRLHVYPTFGHRRLNSIRASDVDAWYASVAVAKSTRAVIYKWLCGIFNAAVRDRILAVSPCQIRGASSRKGQSPLVALTVAQVGALIRCAPARYSALIDLSAQSGLRAGECAGLSLDRIDFERAEITVDRQLIAVTGSEPTFGPPKSAAGYRTVPVTRRLLTSVEGHIEAFGLGTDGLVFTAARGGFVRSSAMSQAIASARTKAAEVGIVVPGWAKFHDLRHHYASVLIDRNVSIKEIQRVLGHETAALTWDTYGHWFPGGDEVIRAAVDEAWELRAA